MILLRVRRAVTLGIALALCILHYWRRRLRGPIPLEQRALWLQRSAARVLRSLGIEWRIEGVPPSCGLVVSNHLSYLDIPIISAAMPCFFVAKMEIAVWPIFGKAARSGGTIFLDRSSLESAMSVADQMAERLKLHVPVVLFPEGTSTDGAQVLRFHARLIDPATSTGTPISPAAIRYLLHDGVEERELCWYGDESFVTHLWKVLGVRSFSAHLCFGEPRIYTDRRVAADETRAWIAAWRQAHLQEVQPAETK